MGEMPPNWRTLSIDNWNEFLRRHSPLQTDENNNDVEIINEAEKPKEPELIEIVLGEKRTPSNALDWLKIISFVKHDDELLVSPDKGRLRANIFELNDNLELPAEYLGAHAAEFITHAQAHYMQGEWAPPISTKLVVSLYERFDLLDLDLTKQVGWDTFWQSIAEKIKERKIANNATDIESEIALRKKQVTAAYRSAVINRTHFVEDDIVEEEENDEEISLCDSRVKEYFHNINCYRISENAKVCYEKIREKYAKELHQNAIKTMMFVKSKLIAGGSLQKAVSFLESEVTRLESLSAYQFLAAEEAIKLVAPIAELKRDYEEIIYLVEMHLKSIASQFIPSFDQDSNVRVLNLILQASDAIANSPAFERRSEVGKITLYKFMNSPEAITSCYQVALNARVEYFCQFLPFELDKLKDDNKYGIQWIRYPRARREVLAKLYHEVLTNKIKYPSPPIYQRMLGVKITSAQRRALLDLQELYFQAYQEDMLVSDLDGAEKLLYAVEDDIMFDKLPKHEITSEPCDYFQARAKILVDIIEKKKHGNGESQEPSLFSIEMPPEYDVTNGLYEELSQIIEHDSPSKDNKRPESKAILMEQPKTLETVNIPLEELLYNQFQHAKLKKRIEAIEDPNERMVEINHLFEHIVCPDNLHRKYKSLGRLFQHKFNTTQKSAIAILQDCYICAVNDAWKAKACSYENGLVNGHLPSTLDITHKNQIFMEYMRNARKSKLINCDVQSGRVEQLHYKIHRMVEALNNIPEKSVLYREG